MKLKFDEITLDNGLKIIAEHNPNLQTVAFGYFVNTGSRDETPEISGVSHFLEHMLFKGTQKRSPEDINREFDEIGANYNAYTNKEHTVFYGASLQEKSAELIDILTDMMRPALRESDFDLEKNVILEEIAMYEDRPDFKVFDIGMEHFYNNHPLGNSVLGTSQSITDLKIEQMRSYFEKRYASDNLYCVVAGNYNWDKVIEQISRLTANWKVQDSKRLYPDFNYNFENKTVKNEKLNRSHVALFSEGLAAQDKNRYAAVILANVLGGSSGRLYWALTDKGLVDSASLSHDVSDQAGAFVGYISADPKELDNILDIYFKVLSDASNITDDEWARAQRKIASSTMMRSETAFNRLMSLGRNYLYNRDYKAINTVVDKILNTSLAEAKEILENKPFDDMSTIILSP
ncbi:MAG TPA: insulinase family protein [Trueperaceae bacterium]|nr:insulinase family protein [Trueperaceae bacterium]